MDQDAIIRYVTETFAGIDADRPTDGAGAGDTFFSYDPRHDLDPARRFPFATIVTKNYTGFDEASRLDRPDVFRLNVGVSRDTFRSLFGQSPGDGDPESTDHDHSALDRLMPHPVYAPQSWVCVLNPSPETFDTVKPLLAEAYSRAADRYAKGQTHRD